VVLIVVKWTVLLNVLINVSLHLCMHRPTAYTCKSVLYDMLVAASSRLSDDVTN